MINVSPFATNVLDLIGKVNIVNSNGDKVTITIPTNDFVVKFNDREVFRSGNNLSVSYFLNTSEISYKQTKLN